MIESKILSVNEMLDCGHCKCKFEGTYAQRWQRKRGNVSNSFCSKICQAAFSSAANTRPKKYQYECKSCHVSFASNLPNKKYCTIKCYSKSDDFRTMITRFAASRVGKTWQNTKARTGSTEKCENCQAEFWKRKSSKRRFCGNVCSRKWMADRFDRFVGMPEDLALPQCYDEFLSQETLRCLIPGCTWVGASLGMHVNISHGITAEEMKRAAGFNLTSGLVSAPLSKSIAERVNPLPESAKAALALNGYSNKGRKFSYKSSEASEHRAKIALINQSTPGPFRCCKLCGKEFQQKTPYGRAVYCGKYCYTEFYRLKNKKPTTQTPA